MIYKTSDWFYVVFLNDRGNLIMRDVKKCYLKISFGDYTRIIKYKVRNNDFYISDRVLCEPYIINYHNDNFIVIAKYLDKQFILGEDLLTSIDTLHSTKDNTSDNLMYINEI